MSPPTFDILNIQIWKVKMSLFLKALGFSVYLATTNNDYCLHGKNIEANTKALNALKSTLNDDYLCRVANVESAFVAWNIITSLGEKDSYYAGSDSDVGSDTSNKCYMVQGDDPLEVNSESDDEDINMSYDELNSLCQLLLERYDIIKKENKNLKKNIACMHIEQDSFRNNIACLEKDNKVLKKNIDCMHVENDSIRNKLACLEKENDDLKNENVSLMSKLNTLCEGNTILKKDIAMVEKQKESILEENKSLKRKFVEKEKDNVFQKKKKNSSSHHAFHATTNEIKNMKNKKNNLSSTLNSCAFNHSKLESLFSKKPTPHAHAHAHHAHAYGAQHDHNHTHKHHAKVYTCTYCGRKGHLAKYCFDKKPHLYFAKYYRFWDPYKNANPKGPKKTWVPKPPPFDFDVGGGSHKT